MRMMNLAPFNRSSVGFDRLFDMLETWADQAGNYPPYNIEKTDEDAYRITLAVAGFSPEDLSVTTQPNELVVAGRKPAGSNGQYLYQGIANRSFQHRFGLADYVRVAGASLDAGLLAIDLVREVPEAMKPRRIEIAKSHQPRIEVKQAA